MVGIIYKGVQLWIIFQICIQQLHIIHVKIGYDGYLHTVIGKFHKSGLDV